MREYSEQVNGVLAVKLRQKKRVYYNFTTYREQQNQSA
jgi:hypothetical protein